MTFAELKATVSHMEEKLVEAKVPFHKAVVFVAPEHGSKTTAVELYPGFVRKTDTGAYRDVQLEAGSTYLEFTAE